MGRNSILYQNEFTGLFFLRGGGGREKISIQVAIEM